MAKIIRNPKDIPDHKGPVPPGLKPPVAGNPYAVKGEPEEVEEFMKIIKEIRQQPSRRLPV